MRRRVPPSSKSDSSEPVTTVSCATNPSSAPRRRPARPSAPNARPRRTRLASAPPDVLSRYATERARTSLPDSVTAAMTPTHLSSRRTPRQKQRASSQSLLDSDTSNAWSSHTGRQWSSRHTQFQQTSRNRSLSPILQRRPAEDPSILSVAQQRRTRVLYDDAGSRPSTSRKSADIDSDQPCQLSTTPVKRHAILKNRTAKISEPTHLHDTPDVCASSNKPSARKKSITVEITPNRPLRRRDDSLVKTVTGNLQSLVAQFLSKDRGSRLASITRPEEQVMSVTRRRTLGDASSAPFGFSDAEHPSQKQSRRGEPEANPLSGITTSDSEFTEVTRTSSTEQQNQPSEEPVITKEERTDSTLSDEAVSMTLIKRRQPDPSSRKGTESNIASGDDSLPLLPSSAEGRNNALVTLESEMARNVLGSLFSPYKSVLPSAAKGEESCWVKQSDTELPKFGVSAQHQYEPRTSGATGNIETQSFSDFPGTSPFLVDISADQSPSEFVVEQPKLKAQKTPVKATWGALTSTKLCQNKRAVHAVQKGIEPRFSSRIATVGTAKSRSEYEFPDESSDFQQWTKDNASSSVLDMSATRLTVRPVPIAAEQKKEDEVLKGNWDTPSTECKYQGQASESPSVPEIIIERNLPKSRYAIPPTHEGNTQATKEPQDMKRTGLSATRKQHLSIFIETSRRSSSREQAGPLDTTETDTEAGDGSTIRDTASESTKAEEVAPSAVLRKWPPEPPTSLRKIDGDRPHVGVPRKGSTEEFVGNTAKPFRDDKKSPFREQDHTTKNNDAPEESQGQAGSLKASAQNEDVRDATKSAASTDKAVQISIGECVARRTMLIAHKASQTSVSLLNEVTQGTLRGSSSVEGITKERREKRRSRDKSKKKSTRRSLSKKGKEKENKKRRGKAEGKDNKPKREAKSSQEAQASTKHPPKSKSARPKGSKPSTSEKKRKQEEKDKGSHESLLSKSSSVEKDPGSKSPPLKTSIRSKGLKNEDKHDKDRSASGSPTGRKRQSAKSSLRKKPKTKLRSKKRDAKKAESEERPSSDLSLKIKQESSKSLKHRAASFGTVVRPRKRSGEVCNFRFAVTYTPVVRGLSTPKITKDGGATGEAPTEPGEPASTEKKTIVSTSVGGVTAETPDGKDSPQPAPPYLAPRKTARPKGSKTSRSKRKKRQKTKRRGSDGSLLSKSPPQEKDRSSKSPPLKSSKRNKGQERADRYDKERSQLQPTSEGKRKSSKSSPRKESEKRPRSKKRKAKKRIQDHGSSSASDLSLKRKQGSSKSRKHKRSTRRSRKSGDSASSVRTAVSPSTGGGELCDFRFGVSYEPVIRGGLRPQKAAKADDDTAGKLAQSGELAAGEIERVAIPVFRGSTAGVQDRKAAPQPAPRNAAKRPDTAAVADAERKELHADDERTPTSASLTQPYWRYKSSGQDDSGADSTSIAFREGATSSGVFQWSTTSIASIWRAQRQFKWSTLRTRIGAALAGTFSSSTTKAAPSAGDEEAHLLRDAPESEDDRHSRSKRRHEKRRGGRKQKSKHRKKAKSERKKRRSTKTSKTQSRLSTTTSPPLEHEAKTPDERQKRRKDAGRSAVEHLKTKEVKLDAARAVAEGPQSSPGTAKSSPTALSPQPKASPSSPTARTSTSGTKSRSSRRKGDRRRGKKKKKSKKSDREKKERHSKKAGKTEGGDAASSPASMVSEKVAEKERRREKSGERHKKKRRHRKPTSSSSPSTDRRHERDKKGSSASSAAKLEMKSRSSPASSSKSSTKKTKSSEARSSGTSKSESSSSGRKGREHGRRSKRHKRRKGHHRDHTKSSKTIVIVDNVSSRNASIYCCLSLAGVTTTLVLIAFALVLLYQHIVVRTVQPPTAHPTESTTTPGHVESTSRKVVSTFSTRARSTRTPATPSGVYYCETKFCTREGAYLSSLLSAAATTPCVNFYEHVCSGWSRGHPENSSSIWTLVSRNTLLQEETLDSVARFLGQQQLQEVRAVAKLYTACADSARSGHVAEELNGMFARWTVDKWPTPRSRASSFDDAWIFAAELSRELDLSTLVEVKTTVNPHQLEAVILELDQPHFLFIQSDQQTSQVMALFRSAIQDGAVAVGGIGDDVLNRLVDSLMKVLEVFASVPRKPTAAIEGAGTGDTSIVRVGNLKVGVQRFLKELVRDVGYLEDDSSVVVHCQRYLDTELELALARLSPHDVLDYMGFLVLIRLAPYVDSSLRGLRALFSLSVVGRSVRDIEGRSQLCAWLIEKTLPDCFAKASQLYRESVGQDFPAREWLSKLESTFARHTRDVVWISNFSSLMVRYRLKRQAVTQFGPRGQTICEDTNLIPATGRLLSYLQAATLQKRDKLRGIFRADDDLRKRVSGSDLDTEASYLPAQDVVHIPAVLFAGSVHENGSLSAFQLPRLAVRYYRGLTRMLFEHIYEHDAPLSMEDEDHHRLTEIRSCFKRDAVQSPRSLRGPEPPVPDSFLVDAMLDQTTALLLAARAFDELLDVHRIWNLDLRFRSLPQLSFRQLFYVYYALDNCEKSDEMYRRHHARRLPAEYRVNLVLRHDARFAEAFGCSVADAMVLTKDNVCRVLRFD